MEKIYTVNEVAELLRVDRTTVITYIKKGSIKAFKVNRNFRIKESEIKFLMEGNNNV